MSEIVRVPLFTRWTFVFEYFVERFWFDNDYSFSTGKTVVRIYLAKFILKLLFIVRATNVLPNVFVPCVLRAYQLNK